MGEVKHYSGQSGYLPLSLSLPSHTLSLMHVHTYTHSHTHSLSLHVNSTCTCTMYMYMYFSLLSLSIQYIFCVYSSVKPVTVVRMRTSSFSVMDVTRERTHTAARYVYVLYTHEVPNLGGYFFLSSIIGPPLTKLSFYLMQKNVCLPTL
jgi:hypothetical protein